MIFVFGADAGYTQPFGRDKTILRHRACVDNRLDFLFRLGFLSSGKVEVFYAGARGCVPRQNFGVWRSLVAHLLWEQGVGGSNPLTPIETVIGEE